MAGITPDVGDWIADMRAGRIDVKLSEKSELSVFAKGTLMDKH